MNNANSFSSYEIGVSSARKRFSKSQWVKQVLSPSVNEGFLELFLLYFCSLGISMTKPVESWIRRAGERCIDTGFTSLGKALILHASQEAGHHHLMRKDTLALIERRSRRGDFSLHIKNMISHPPTQGILRYIKLHERVIQSAFPFAQIAIEYEIERMSMLYGPKLIEVCLQTLGKDAANYLSFVTEHATLDIGHTKFNKKQLSEFLSQHPETLPTLISAGTEALEAYSSFFDDCIQLACLGEIEQRGLLAV